MKIVLDLQGAQSASRFRGIGRYSLAFAKAVVRNADKHEVRITLNHAFPETIENIRAAFQSLLDPTNILVYQSLPNSAEIVEENLWRSRASQLIRESFLTSLQADVIHTSSLFEGFDDDSSVSIGRVDSRHIAVATLYDLIPLLHPDQYLPTDRTKHWYADRIDSLKQADLLLAISQSAKEEAAELLGIAPENIITIYGDADPIFRRLDLGDRSMLTCLEKNRIKRDCIVVTGPIAKGDPRKNCLATIEVFSQLPLNVRKRHQLVVVGVMVGYQLKDLMEYCTSLGLEADEVIFTGRVSDEDLVILYNDCKLFVLPSIHEGFGLPALEAMRCGAAVIGSNTSSIPEVIGNKDALFDPRSNESFGLKLHEALVNESFRKSLREAAAIHKKRFSWDRTAKIALNAFEEKTKQARSFLVPHGVVSALSKITSGAPSEQDLFNVALAISENRAYQENRNLFVDVSFLNRVDLKSGIQRAVRNILNQLLNSSENGIRVVPISRDDSANYRVASRFLIPNSGQEHVVIGEELLDIGMNDIYLGLDLDMGVVEYEDCLNYWRHHRQRGLKVSHIVYDLLPILHKQWFDDRVAQIYSRWLRHSVNHADGMICISQSVADELNAYLEDNPPERKEPLRIGYFHLGADREASLPSRKPTGHHFRILEQIQARPSCLVVGTIEPRKGHAQALAAFELLWHQGLQVNLMIIGKQGWSTDELLSKLKTHSELGRRLFWLEDVNDEALEEFYSKCTLLLAASEGEGFGLPLVEAAQHDLPILARDIPVFREVAGKHAMYFHGNEPEVLAQAIRKWLEMNEKGQVPRSSEMSWLTWEQSAKQLKEVLFGDDNWYATWTP